MKQAVLTEGGPPKTFAAPPCVGRVMGKIQNDRTVTSRSPGTAGIAGDHGDRGPTLSDGHRNPESQLFYPQNISEATFLLTVVSMLPLQSRSCAQLVKKLCFSKI